MVAVKLNTYKVISLWFVGQVQHAEKLSAGRGTQFTPVAATPEDEEEEEGGAEGEQDQEQYAGEKHQMPRVVEAFESKVADEVHL